MKHINNMAMTHRQELNQSTAATTQTVSLTVFSQVSQPVRNIPSVKDSSGLIARRDFSSVIVGFWHPTVGRNLPLAAWLGCSVQGGAQWEEFSHQGQKSMFQFPVPRLLTREIKTITLFIQLFVPSSVQIDTDVQSDDMSNNAEKQNMFSDCKYVAIWKNFNIKHIWVILHFHCLLYNFYVLTCSLNDSMRNCNVNGHEWSCWRSKFFELYWHCAWTPLIGH